MLRKTVTYLIITFSVTQSFAQSNSVDSLKALIPLTKNDTVKVDQLNVLSSELLYNDPLEAMLYAKQALNLSRSTAYTKGRARSEFLLGLYSGLSNEWKTAREYFMNSIEGYRQLGDKKNEARVVTQLGISFGETGDHDKAMELYIQGLKIHQTIGDSLLIAQSYYNIGAGYNAMGDNKRAFQYTTKALKLFEQYNDLGNVWSTLNNLGIIHDDLGLYPKALEYYLKALAITDELGDEGGRIILSNNIGIIYEIIEDYDKALEYFEQALESSVRTESLQDQAGLHNNIALIYTNNGDVTKSLYHHRRAIAIYESNAAKCALPYPLEGMGDLYMKQGILDSAYYYFQRALTLANECQEYIVIITAHKNLGRLYNKQGKSQMAVKSFKTSLDLAQRLQYKNDIKENAFELYQSHKKLGQYGTALTYHEMYKSAQDSLFNNENTKKITRLDAEYEFQQERQQLEYEQEKQNLQHAAELNRQQLIRNTILIILVLAILLVFTLGRSFYIIRKRNKQLLQLNDEKNTLIGVVAHDLRSPLNNIRAVMPVIRTESERLSSTQSEFLEMIGTSTERMGEMIKRVLDINAIEAQKINLKMEAVDLGETLEMTAQNFQIITDQKKVGVKKNIEHKRHYAHVDKNYLIQVVENLLSNAIKFSTPNNNIYLDVLSEDGKEMIKIKDEGPGISEEDQKKMFTKFQKLSAKPTANESSTGLGLSIAKKYIEAMQGKIWCESAIGNGATFIIEFNSIRSTVY